MSTNPNTRSERVDGVTIAIGEAPTLDLTTITVADMTTTSEKIEEARASVSPHAPTLEALLAFATEQGETVGAADRGLFDLGCAAFHSAAGQRIPRSRKDTSATAAILTAFAEARNAMPLADHMDPDNKNRIGKMHTFSRVAANVSKIGEDYPGWMTTEISIYRANAIAEHKKASVFEMACQLNRAHEERTQRMTRDEVRACLTPKARDVKGILEKLETMAKQVEAMFKLAPSDALVDIANTISAAVDEYKLEEMEARKAALEDVVAKAREQKLALAKWTKERANLQALAPIHQHNQIGGGTKH